MCVSACTQKAPKLRCYFLKRRLTNTPGYRRLADGQLSSLYPPSPSFSSFGAASVMLCCSRPASSSTPLRPSVYYPSISLVVDIIYIRTCCEYLNVFYIFDPVCTVLKLGWNSTARTPRLVLGPRSLLPPLPPFLQASFPPSVASTFPLSLLALRFGHLVSPSICDF